MKIIIKQQGNLMIAAVALIVFFALLGTALANLFIRTATSSAQLGANAQAGPLAYSGLALGENALSEKSIANRVSCTSLNQIDTIDGNSYQATSTSSQTINPLRTFSTLKKDNISDTIELDDSSSFATSGFVRIDDEIFTYKSKDDSKNTLNDVTRAFDNSFESVHEKGAIVSQYQCMVLGTANVPASNPTSTAKLEQSIHLDYAIAAANSGLIFNWNSDGNELNWSSLSVTSTPDLLSIDALNSHQALATSSAEGNNFRLYQLTGNTWSKVLISSKSNEVATLNDISYVSSEQAFAVGNVNSDEELTILSGSGEGLSKWDRIKTNKKCSAFSINDGIDMSDMSLLAIDVIDSKGDGKESELFGFAAGGSTSSSLSANASGSQSQGNSRSQFIQELLKSQGNINGVRSQDNSQQTNSTTEKGLILKLSTCFSEETIPSNTGQVQAIKVIRNGSSTPIEAFAVANNINNSNQGLILRYHNNSWSVALITSGRLYAIDMIDNNQDGIADDGFAVGTNGLSYRYVNGSWQQQSNIGSQTLKGLSLVSSTDGWAVGANGARYHFNGQSWQAHNNGVSTSQTINAISLIAPLSKKAGPIRQA